jgi:hypothetical protein
MLQCSIRHCPSIYVAPMVFSNYCAGNHISIYTYLPCTSMTYFLSENTQAKKNLNHFPFHKLWHSANHNPRWWCSTWFGRSNAKYTYLAPNFLLRGENRCLCSTASMIFLKLCQCNVWMCSGVAGHTRPPHNMSFGSSRIAHPKILSPVFYNASNVIITLIKLKYTYAIITNTLCEYLNV